MIIETSMRPGLGIGETFVIYDLPSYIKACWYNEETDMDLILQACWYYEANDPISHTSSWEKHLHGVCIS